MPPLDGTEPIKPTPFDAHEQIARVQHEEAPKEAGYAHSGLQAADPEDAVTEFPKAVAHDEATGEPILVNNAKEEKAYLAKAADAKAADAAPDQPKSA